MGRILRFLTLAFFALMQCIAPVAHAHTDGHSVGYGVHLDLETYNSPEHSVAHASSVSVTHTHSSIISMPPEHSSDKHCLPIHSPHETSFILGTVAVTQIGILHSTPLVYQYHAYDRPFGQAPPL